MNVFELFNNKISENQWSDGKDAWSNPEEQPISGSNNQWTSESEDPVIALTGVDEGLSFNSQKECMDYFEKIGKTRAQGAAAWNSTYANKKPKDSLSKVKPFDPKKHGNQWWMKEDQMTPQAQQAAQALQKGIQVAQQKYPNLDHSFATNVIKEIKPDGTIIVAGDNSTSNIKQLLAQGGGANFKVVNDAELQIAQQRPISQTVDETSSDVFANGDSASVLGNKIDEMNKIDPNDERPPGSLYTYRQIADKERFYKQHDERRFKSIRDWVADHPEDEEEMRSKYPQAFNQGVAEGSGNKITYKQQKGKNKFSVEMLVDGKSAGIFQYDANSGRTIVELDPKYRGQGLGQRLILKGIYTAAMMGLDYAEDESRTQVFDNAMDSLADNGYIVNDDEYWYVTDKGEQFLKQGVAEGSLNEFAIEPSNSGNNDDEYELLYTLVKMWWLGNEQQHAKAEKTLASMGISIDEDDPNIILRRGKQFLTFPMDDFEQGVDESVDDNTAKDEVYGAIIRRIAGAHRGLITQYGIDNVMDAAREVADWNSNVHEIGTSDVSNWVREVFRKLTGKVEEGNTNMEEKKNSHGHTKSQQAAIAIAKKGMEETAAWQKKSGKNKTGGLNKKGVASYRREHPGSKLQTAVTKKPSEIKKGSKDASRRKSFCARMKGMKKHNTSSKTAHDPNSRINKSLRKWHCESIEELQQMLMIAEATLRTAEQLDEGMREAFLNKVAPSAVNAILESKKK